MIASNHEWNQMALGLERIADFMWRKKVIKAKAKVIQKKARKWLKTQRTARNARRTP